MPSAANECVVKPAAIEAKSPTVKDFRKKQLNFFNSPDRVFFPDIIDGNVSTEKFLEAIYYLTGSFDLLGYMMGGVAKLVRANHAGVENFYKKDPVKYKYMKDMLLAEKATGKQDMAICLVRVMRTLKQVNTAFENAYEDTLKSGTFNSNAVFYESYKIHSYPYHNFLLRQLCKTGLLMFLPGTEDFTKALCFGETPDSSLGLLEDAKSLLSSAKPLIKHLDEVYINNDLPINIVV